MQFILRNLVFGIAVVTMTRLILISTTTAAVEAQNMTNAKH
jgi:hypothetical protein